MKKSVFTILLLVLGCALSALEFKSADIVIAPGSPVSVRYAAKELAHFLHRITGGEFNITSKPAKGKVVIHLGNSAAARKAGADVSKIKAEGFYLGAAGRQVIISGPDSSESRSMDYFPLFFTLRKKGTLNGVYELLEQQGVRWPAPGAKFEFVPKKKTIVVSNGIKKYEPSFPSREAFPNWKLSTTYPDTKEYSANDNGYYIWMMRLRLRGRSIYPGSHSQQYMGFDKIWGKKYPDRMQLKNGKRDMTFLCWTHPEVEEAWFRCADAYFSGKKPAAAGFPHLKFWPGQQYKEQFVIEPADIRYGNNGRCECARCDAFRKKYPTSWNDDTELMWRVVCRVAERIKARHKDKLIVTLSYPPKSGFPTSIKIPDNVRVSFCPVGAGEIPLKERFQPEFDLLKKWSSTIGPESLVLRTYQVESFGRKVPGLPDIYPMLSREYLKIVRNYCSGLNNEIVCAYFTARVADVYLQSRFLWNIDRDPKKEFNEFFKIMYGPAADPMAKLYTRFEENFKEYVRKGKGGLKETVGAVNPGEKLRRVAWTIVYTDAEVKKIDALIAQAQRLAAGNKEYTRRVNLVKKYIVDLMKVERSETILPPELPELAINGNKWSKKQTLHPAESSVSASKAKTTFRLRRNGKKLEVEICCTEPNPAGVICADRKSGDTKLWQDDDVELFVFAKGKLRQIMVNYKGKYSCREASARGDFWRLPKDIKCVKSNTKGGWKTVISLDLPADKFRLNLIRGRKNKDAKPEYTTWSGRAKRGSWQNPALWGYIAVK